MKPAAPITRREFIAGTSALLFTSNLTAGEPKAADTAVSEKLALEGGEKAVKQAARRPKRWGDPELAQFTDMLKQDSLIYWKAPQTTLLIKRFQEHVPLKYA